MVFVPQEPILTLKRGLEVAFTFLYIIPSSSCEPIVQSKGHRSQRLEPTIPKERHAKYQRRQGGVCFPTLALLVDGVVLGGININAVSADPAHPGFPLLVSPCALSVGVGNNELFDASR